MSKLSNINLTEFESLFKTYYSELCGFANKYLEDLEAAEEIVQAFFVKFWENRNDLNIQTSPKSYIFTSIRNACFNQIKHIKVREEYKLHNKREMDSSNYSVDDEFQASELDLKIKKSIEELPESRRQIFMMSRYEGLKYKEIAEQLKISIKTVENQMGSALKYLKTELSDYIVYLAFLFSFLN